MSVHQQLEEFIKKLPNKDGIICLKLLEKGNLSAIYDIVKSDITRYDLDPVKYADYDTDAMNSIRAILNKYVDAEDMKEFED